MTTLFLPQNHNPHKMIISNKKIDLWLEFCCNIFIEYIWREGWLTWIFLPLFMVFIFFVIFKFHYKTLHWNFREPCFRPLKTFSINFNRDPTTVRDRLKFLAEKAVAKSTLGVLNTHRGRKKENLLHKNQHICNAWLARCFDRYQRF